MGGALLMDWLLKLGCNRNPSGAQTDAELALAQLLTAGVWVCVREREREKERAKTLCRLCL